MNIIVNNLQDKWKEELFQCGGYLDKSIMQYFFQPDQ